MEKEAQRLELWREAMAQLRYLNNEVWVRFQFFVWFELVLLLLGGGSAARRSAAGSILFFLAGLLVGLVARWVLKRNRIYYLQMLGKKSMLEEELGLYGQKFEGTETDYALPWRLTPEVIRRIKGDFEGWVNSSIRSKGTIARPLFIILEVLIVLFALGLVVTVYALMRSRI